MKIMLVDDSKTMRSIQRRTLEAIEAGVEFTEAGDGVEACAAVAQLATSGGRFDLILLDWNMPNMDGLAFVTRFRAAGGKTPVIMCTTEAEKSRIVEALKAGVNNYVVKPFTPEALTERVRQTLDKAKAAA